MSEENMEYKVGLDISGVQRGLQLMRASTLSTNREIRKINATLKLLVSNMNASAVATNKTTNAMKRSTTAGKKKASSMKTLLASYFGIHAAIALTSRALRLMTDYVGESTDAFYKFDNSMKEVSTILSDISSNLPGMTSGVEGMSKAFGKSATDLAEGLYRILSAAVPVADSMQFLYIASKAAVAGLTTVEKSVEVLTTVYNAYGKTVAQMTHVSDIMFKSVIRGSFKFDDLAASLGYVVPIAAQVGIHFDELSAALSTATRFGQHVTMVARGLALGIQNIIKPSEQARQVAQEYGIVLSQASLRAKGLVGFLKDLNEKTGGNASIISKLIPNMRSYRVMMVLAGDGMVEVAGDAELMRGSLGATEEAFDKVASSAQTAKNIIKEYGEDVKRSVGESLIELDLFWQKLDMFKGIFIQSFVEGPQNIGEALASFGGPFLAPFLKAGTETKKIGDLIDSQLIEKTKKWQESLKNPGGEIKKGIFETLFEGNEPDLSGMKAAEKKYNDLLKIGEKLGQHEIDLRLKGGSASELYEITTTIEQVKVEIEEARQGWEHYTVSLDDAKAKTYFYADSIDILAVSMSKLKGEIGELNNLYDGSLGKKLEVAEQNKVVADMTHYLGLAFEEEGYQVEMAGKNFEWYNDEIASAVSVVRAYEQQTKAATDAQKEFNFELARNRIETMRIQLLGMMRRRGNTRGELRVLKQLSIQRSQIQIEEAEKDLANEIAKNEGITNNKEMAYAEAKRLLDEMVRAEQHTLWLTKDTRAEDIADLRKTILAKEDEYRGYIVDITVAQQGMGTSLEIYRDLAAQIYGEDIPGNVQNTITALGEVVRLQNIVAGNPTGTGSSNKGMSVSKPVTQVDIMKDPVKAINLGKIQKALPWITRGRGGFARGTNYVGSEGLYNLHKGEQVIPNNQSKGESVVINISVTGNTIADSNVDNIASQIADQVQKGLINKRTGKSNYRLR